jgi:hypothetical protein
MQQSMVVQTQVMAALALVVRIPEQLPELVVQVS